MKLRINGFENEINFSEDCVNVIQIKNRKLFQHFIEKLYELNEGNESLEIQLLSDNEENIKFEKNVFMMTDLYNIDANSKNILTKIYDLICKDVKLDNEIEIEKNIFEIRTKIIEEVNELPYEFIMKDEIDINEILKLYSLKIDMSNYKNVLERLELIINLLSTLNLANILIVANLKKVLDDEQLVELYKYSLYNKINLLLIESDSCEKLKYEEVLEIDEYFNDTKE